MLLKKIISEGNEITENINDIKSEIGHGSIGDPLNMYRSASNETTLPSEILNVNNEENVIIAPGEGIMPVSILSVEYCEEEVFPYLLPTDKFGFDAPRDIPISPSWYFNQMVGKLNPMLLLVYHHHILTITKQYG